MKPYTLWALAVGICATASSCGRKSEEERAAQQAKEAAGRLESAARDAAEKLEKANKLSGNASTKAQQDLEEAKKRIDEATKTVPPTIPPPAPPDNPLPLVTPP